MCQFRSNLILTLGFKEINKIVRIQALAEWKVFFPFKITFLGWMTDCDKKIKIRIIYLDFIETAGFNYSEMYL